MRAQVTLFVIVAILIVSAIGITYYAASSAAKAALNKEQAIIKAVPEKFRPAEINFISCLKSKAQDSLTILGSQAGYINLPAEDPASDYMPFSNTADFLGLKVPYWWYVSGNGIQKNQIPSMDYMKNELESYMNSNVEDCLSSLRILEGYEIFTEKNPETNVTINENYVDFVVSFPIKIQLGTAAITVQIHQFVIPMQLGKLYRIARQINDAENSNYFIEERTLDMIFMYPEIPSTSINFECSPRIWTKTAVKSSLQNIISNNIQFIRIEGTNYGISDKYFEIDAGKTDRSVRANIIPMTSPFKFEVSPSDGEFLKGEPMVGEGENEAVDFVKSLFCLSNYHFVYTVGYPVVIQLQDSNGNTFQFAVLSMIVNNQAKEDRIQAPGVTINPELCQIKLASETVNAFTYDKNGQTAPLNGVDISYKCITTTCSIGNTLEKNSITAQFPQCVNGLLIARKEGYNPAVYTLSTNINDQEVSLVLEKYTNFTVNVSVINKDGSIRAVNKDETVVLEMNNDAKSHSTEIIYPSQSSINLLQGDYSVKISLFEKGSFLLKGVSTRQCTSVPRADILGLLGFMQEKCIEISTPDATLQQVFGGGAEFSAAITDGKMLNLYLLKTDSPKNANDLDRAYQISQTASSNPLFKIPEIK